jgi:hypothetical protein
MNSLKNNTTPPNKLSTEFKYTLLTLCAFGLLLCAVLWPLAFIWALNCLFAFDIKYTFWNWLATWVLIFTFQGAINIKKERTINVK